MVLLHLHGADLFVDPRIVYVNPEKGYVGIPLRNVGAGLAVVDDEGLEVRGLDGQLEDVTVDRPRVPPGETTRVNIALLLAEGEEAKVFSVTIPYGDLAGEQNTDVTVHLRRSEAVGRLTAWSTVPRDGGTQGSSPRDTLHASGGDSEADEGRVGTVAFSPKTRA